MHLAKPPNRRTTAQRLTPKCARLTLIRYDHPGPILFILRPSSASSASLRPAVARSRGIPKGVAAAGGQEAALPKPHSECEAPYFDFV
jgi:hypothetical protein